MCCHQSLSLTVPCENSLTIAQVLESNGAFAHALRWDGMGCAGNLTCECLNWNTVKCNALRNVLRCIAVSCCIPYGVVRRRRAALRGTAPHRNAPHPDWKNLYCCDWLACCRFTCRSTTPSTRRWRYYRDIKWRPRAKPYVLYHVPLSLLQYYTTSRENERLARKRLWSEKLANEKIVQGIK